MPARRLPMPPLARLLELARTNTSLAKVAEAIGMQHSTFIARLNREGWKDEVQGALGTLSLVPESEVSEEEVLKARVTELEKTARQQRKVDVRDERIFRAFEDALADVKPRYRPRKPRPATPEPHEHILLLSDLHAGERVSQEETLGLNTYDWQIMLERLSRVRDSVLSFQEHRPYPISRLSVWMLGDMLSGTIHDELAETNELPAAEATVQLGHDLSRWLEEFVPHYEHINVAGVIGNHPRHHRKPRAKQPTSNDDWLLYRFIETYHRNHPAFSFHFPQAAMADIKVAKRWRALLLHGDGIRSTMVDVPWGGIVRYTQKLETQFQKAGKPIDLIACGHWHTANAIEGISTRLFVNGALKGIDEFSLRRFGSARPPSQLLLTIHPKRGVTDTSFINCTDTVPNAETLAA